MSRFTDIDSSSRVVNDAVIRSRQGWASTLRQYTPSGPARHTLSACTHGMPIQYSGPREIYHEIYHLKVCCSESFRCEYCHVHFADVKCTPCQLLLCFQCNKILHSSSVDLIRGIVEWQQEKRKNENTSFSLSSSKSPRVSPSHTRIHHELYEPTRSPIPRTYHSPLSCSNVCGIHSPCGHSHACVHDNYVDDEAYCSSIHRHHH